MVKKLFRIKSDPRLIEAATSFKKCFIKSTWKANIIKNIKIDLNHADIIERDKGQKQG